MLLSDMELPLEEPPDMLLPDIEPPDMELLLIEPPDMLLSDMELPLEEPPDMELLLVLSLDVEFEDEPLLSVDELSLSLLPQAERAMVSRAAAIIRITFFIM